MATKQCIFIVDGEEKRTEGSGPNDAVARRAAISKFNWEGDHDDVSVFCE